MEMPGKMEMVYSIGLNRPRGPGSLPIIPSSKYRLLRISHPEKLVRGNLPQQQISESLRRALGSTQQIT